jgi:hypothetical protein
MRALHVPWLQGENFVFLPDFSMSTFWINSFGLPRLVDVLYLSSNLGSVPMAKT